MIQARRWRRSQTETTQMQAEAQVAHARVDSLMDTIDPDDFPRSVWRGLRVCAEEYSDFHARRVGNPAIDGQSYRAYRRMRERYTQLAARLESITGRRARDVLADEPRPARLQDWVATVLALLCGGIIVLIVVQAWGLLLTLWQRGP